MSVASDRITQVSLSDSAVGVHKSSSRLPHKLVEPPAPCAAAVDNHPPKIAWEAFYPKGSINPSATIPGGFGFYMSGPPDFAHRLESAREALFSYRVMFEEEWEWVKGGKLPGICKNRSLECQITLMLSQLVASASCHIIAPVEGKTIAANVLAFV